MMPEGALVVLNSLVQVTLSVILDELDCPWTTLDRHLMDNVLATREQTEVRRVVHDDAGPEKLPGLRPQFLGAGHFEVVDVDDEEHAKFGVPIATPPGW